MSQTKPLVIKAVIPPHHEFFAAFASSDDDDIESRIEPVICWAVISHQEDDYPDEIVGQIPAGDSISEAINVDEDEGFGPFIGYFQSMKAAQDAIDAYEESRSDDEDDEGDEEEDEEDEDGDTDDEEEGEDDDDENDDDEDSDDDDEDDDEDEDYDED